MADINRRNAFSYAFGTYTPIILHIVDNHDAHLIDKKTGEYCVIVANDTRNDVALVFMAQFFCRMMQTRCNGATEALVIFGNECVNRYRTFCERLPKGKEVHCLSDRRAALNAIEQSISDTVFLALAEEVKICEELGNDFEEVEFWCDFFLCFSASSRPGHPRWTIAAQEIFLNNRDDFKAATREFPDHD